MNNYDLNQEKWINSTTDATIADKLIDAQTPGFQAEFDPDEAERIGAFKEDALTEQDALDSSVDLVDVE